MSINIEPASAPVPAVFRTFASGLNAALITLGFVALVTVSFAYMAEDELFAVVVSAKPAKADDSSKVALTEDSWTLGYFPVMDKRDHLAIRDEFILVNTSSGQGLKARAGALEISAEMERVRDWISATYRVSSRMLEPVLLAAEENALDAGLDPLLIVAVMAIESSFNPKAQSHAGAQGLMQVIPRWHMDKIGEGAPENALFDPVINVRVGTEVLVEGLQRYGSLQAALQYYNGARNDPNARYTKRVLAMKDQLVQVARVDGDA